MTGYHLKALLVPEAWLCHRLHSLPRTASWLAFHLVAMR